MQPMLLHRLDVPLSSLCGYQMHIYQQFLVDILQAQSTEVVCQSKLKYHSLSQCNRRNVSLI